MNTKKYLSTYAESNQVDLDAVLGRHARGNGNVVNFPSSKQPGDRDKHIKQIEIALAGLGYKHGQLMVFDPVTFKPVFIELLSSKD